MIKKVESHELNEILNVKQNHKARIVESVDNDSVIPDAIYIIIMPKNKEYTTN